MTTDQTEREAEVFLAANLIATMTVLRMREPSRILGTPNLYNAACCVVCDTPEHEHDQPRVLFAPPPSTPTRKDDDR